MDWGPLYSFAAHTDTEDEATRDAFLMVVSSKRSGRWRLPNDEWLILWEAHIREKENNCE